MSILLDALRKSEKERHKPEPPDIHSGELHSPVSRLPKRGLIALLLIVTVSVGAWFLWQHYQKTDGSEQSSVSLTPEQSQTTGTQGAKLETGDSKGSKTETSTAVAKGATGQSRTPVESFQQVARDSLKPQAATANGVKPRATPYIISTPANQVAKAGSKKTVSKKPASKKPPPQKSATSKPVAKKSANKKSPSQESATGKPAKVKPDAARKEFRPEPPAPISYWDLPDAIRAKVPEIKFSVLVYASDPADRFVLINGARLKEGDKVSPGLLVKEIRRDGIIFKYRLYEFLVER